MKLSIKLSVAFLGLMLMVGGCDMSQVSNTDHSNSIEKLSPIPGSSHENSVPVEYEIIDLDPEGSYSAAYGINDFGQVVGIKGVSENKRTAYFWDTKKNTTRNLGSLGGNLAYGFRINNKGQIAGASYNSSSERRATFWNSANDNITNLGTFEGSFATVYSQALGINENGDVVGHSTSPDGILAFKWNYNDGLLPLKNITNHNTAWDINNEGSVVGVISNPDNFTKYFAAQWDSHGNLEFFDFIPGSYAQAQAINNTGEIVGYTRLTNREAAFLIDENGNYLELGTLDNSNYSDAIDINDHSQIVGVSKNAEGNFRAFIWDSKNGMKDLGTLGGASSQAWGINNKGQIVGFSETESGETHAVLWNPVSNSDTTPPEISYEQVTASLWPPNHKMRKVLADISASDDTDENPSLDISVESNEAVDGIGDGNTDPDWEIVQAENGSYDLYLRAERNGPGTDRVYTIMLTAEDEAGNISEKEITVNVPHDSGLTQSNY